MIFSSPDTVDIPNVDILTHIFPETPTYPQDRMIYLDGSDRLLKYRGLNAREVKSLVRRVGSGIQKAGLQKGCIFTGVNPSYTADELSYQISHSKAKILITENDLVDVAMNAAKQAGSDCKVTKYYTFDTPKQDPFQPIYSLVDKNEIDWPRLKTKEECENTVALLMYSSGTTGRSKGVMQSHRNIVANMEQSLLWRRRTIMRKMAEGETIQQVVNLGHLPVYHAFGMASIVFLAVKMGATFVMMPKFSLENLLNNIQIYRATALSTVPPVILAITKAQDLVAKYDLSSLTTVSVGSAPLSKEVEEEMHKIFKGNLGFMSRQGWGMTELTCTGTSWALEMEYAPGSCGCLLPNLQAKILDEEGKELGVNEVGELLIKGPNVMKGYLDNVEATNDTIRDGWLITGDIAKFDSYGRMFIVDRKKELIKYGGFQVAPAELEALINEHPLVADCAVVGVVIGGKEMPKAFVVLKQPISADEIASFVNTRVANHKKLRGGVVIVKEIPKSNSGKLLRRILRKSAQDEIDQTERAKI